MRIICLAQENNSAEWADGRSQTCYPLVTSPEFYVVILLSHGAPIFMLNPDITAGQEEMQSWFTVSWKDQTCDPCSDNRTHAQIQKVLQEGVQPWQSFLFIFILIKTGSWNSTKNRPSSARQRNAI